MYLPKTNPKNESRMLTNTIPSMHKNNRQEFVFADNRAETLQTKRLQQLMHRPSTLVMQPKWMDNGSVYLQWEPITEEGVVWFYNRRTGLMFYIVQGSHTE